MAKKLNRLPFKIIDQVSLCLIKIYRLFISPLIGNNCRFIPSCSEYASDIIKEYGLFRGTPYILKRILSCHPFGRSGYDPVKKKSEKNKRNKNL